MTRITTHVLDVAAGRPAGGLRVRLERLERGSAAPLAEGATGEDGRLHEWDAEVTAGRYRLVFETGAWFAADGRATLFPEIAVELEVGSERHCHLPLLLAPFGYSVYRGS